MTQSTDTIDQLAVALIDEFNEHLTDYWKHDATADRRMVFESWVIQKIAGIHFALAGLVEGRIIGGEGE